MDALVPEQLTELMAAYMRLRPLVAALHGRIVRAADKGAVRACAKRLGLLTGKGGRLAVDFGHPLARDIFQDYLLYMYRPKGVSLVRKMRNRRLWPPDSDEQRLLGQMDQARFSLFLLREPHPEGGAVALDLVTGERRFILDQFVPEQNMENVLAAFRLFPFQGVWMHTGAPMVFGALADANGLPPVDLRPEEEDERLLNEACIRRWRAMIGGTGG